MAAGIDVTRQDPRFHFLIERGTCAPGNTTLGGWTSQLDFGRQFVGSSTCHVSCSQYSRELSQRGAGVFALERRSP